MAPIRRYLRITKHSVLEVRIYLVGNSALPWLNFMLIVAYDRPSDAETWLLRQDNPALPHVIQAVRPLVLPKLREENERANGRGKGKAKKKGVKDVVVQDDFEVSIFLTEHSSRHSILTKQKVFKDKPRIQSNSGKLTGWLAGETAEQPVVVDEASTEPIVIREEDDDDHVNLTDIPEADGSGDHVIGTDVGDDDKKKLGLNTLYEGFSIYGRILCLVVKRRGVRNQAGNNSASASSQQMMENWVSTQAAAEQADDEDDIG